MEYKDIFSPETLGKLNKQSQENLKKILGDKSLMQTMISSGKLLGEIMEIEAPYKEQLEQLAIQMVEDMYPIIEEDKINIDAKIVSVADVNKSLDEIKVNNPNIKWNSFKIGDKISIDSMIPPITRLEGTIISINFYRNNRKIKIFNNVDYVEFGVNYQGSTSFNNFIFRYYFNPKTKQEMEWNTMFKTIKRINNYVIKESTPESKRRVINGITQGAALHGTFSFYMFKEYLDAIDDTLVDKYNQLMKEVFGVYDDDNAIAMFLNAIAQGQKTGGGSSKVIINEQQSGPTIQARAICFPMLVHEIIKGLYELVSLQGFQGTKDQNQQVVDKVDKLENEPHDLKYGKFIFDALNDIFANSQYSDSRIREFFFAEVYQLGDTEFVEFVENAINKQLTSSQKRWVEQTLKSIQMDLRDDDFDSTGLDEIKINKPGINFPYKINSQEHWDRVFPILKQQGFKWGDGDELNNSFSDNHDFPQYIDNYGDKEIIINDELDESKSPCWDGYKKLGTKEKNGKTVNNCVPINEYTIDDEEVEEFLEEIKKCNIDLQEGILEEAEYQGRKVTLNKPMQGDSKKFKVYVKNEKGNVVKVNFGAKGMNIKKNNPIRRKAFRARHNCSNPGPKWKARYWSCKKW
jgi:hypothetical protein